MKKLLPLVVMVFIISLSSFQNAVDHSTARANFIQGFYVFTDATPIAPFDVLGDEKNGATLGSAQYSDVRDNLIKKVRKEFPTADGIIFNMVSGKADHATVIKFK